MPNYVTRMSEALNKFKKSVNGSRILVCGIAYKKDIEDTRNSPAEIIIKRLIELGADIDIYDPVVSKFTDKYLTRDISCDIDRTKEYDAALILVDHSTLDKDSIIKSSDCILDTRGVFKNNENVSA